MCTLFDVKQHRRQAGFTLVEIMIAGSLALVVLTLVFQTLLPTMAASTKAARRTELHQRATLLGDRVVADLRRSSRAGIGITKTAERFCVSIHPREPGSMEVAWQTELRVYDWRNTRVTGWNALLPNPPEAPLIPAIATIDGLPKQENLRFADVSSFEVILDSGPGVRVRLVLQGKGEKEKLELSRAVFLRNPAD